MVRSIPCSGRCLLALKTRLRPGITFGTATVGLLAGSLLAATVHAEDVENDAASSKPSDSRETEGVDPARAAFAHFSRGLELYDEGDLRAALFEFTRAQEIAPNYKLFYNIAVCEL